MSALVLVLVAVIVVVTALGGVGWGVALVYGLGREDVQQLVWQLHGLRKAREMQAVHSAALASVASSAHQCRCRLRPPAVSDYQALPVVGHGRRRPV